MHDVQVDNAKSLFKVRTRFRRNKKLARCELFLIVEIVERQKGSIDPEKELLFHPGSFFFFFFGERSAEFASRHLWQSWSSARIRP